MKTTRTPASSERPTGTPRTAASAHPAKKAGKAAPRGRAPARRVQAATAIVTTGTESSTLLPGMEGENTGAKNLTDHAYAVMRRLILERELLGGEVLVEGRLAERLQMSRTPLREALLRLEGEGLIVRANARSYAVRRITAAHYFQCLQVRERLESQAVSLALGRIPDQDVQRLRDSIAQLDMSQQGSSHWQADDEIHQVFSQASGNEMLAQTIAHLRVLCRLFEVVDPFNRIEEDRAEHIAILDAYRSGDAARAEAAVVAHLRNLGRYTLSRLSNGLVTEFA